MGYKEAYAAWLKGEAFDEDTKKELAALTDEREIEERFYTDLAFGTAGLRGIMGAGTNRINRYTVGRATLGLARVLAEAGIGAEKRGVAVAYDTRNNSEKLAGVAAAVLSACGIPVYLFDQAVPVPVLSFTVRDKGCAAGVVLTASHNPPAYNGYKVYDETGCQLGPDAAGRVTEKIGSIRWEEIPQNGREDLIVRLGDGQLEKFEETVLTRSILGDAAAKAALSIVYTPIHGTGKKPVTAVLARDGFTRVAVVPEQAEPDGNFPTVKSPNPEERGALAMGIALAEKTGADLVIGTDPDADRVGCAVRHDGEMTLLTGNQVGALLTDFLTRDGRAKAGDVLIKTIVTADLGAAIAQSRGCEVMEVLTGFRFIGEKMNGFEKETPRKHRYLMGYEESYGYLVGTHARDKDSVVSSLLIAEMAAFHKKAGRTLIDALNELYAAYGYYLDKTEAFSLQGMEGLRRIGAIMDDLRAHPDFLPDVRQIKDYAPGVDGLPKANVLKWSFNGGGWLAARPSGTEPKIKFYYSVREEDRAKAEKKLEALRGLILEKTGL
ncbi:MAG: phospho-sugar mutase [Clostridia bacterium]|nr:phospho-sugar mutase [Clostridia bacterium]